MYVYGKNVAKELQSKIEKVYVANNFKDKELLKSIQAPIIYVDKNKLDKMVDGVHQGIVLKIADYEYKDISSLNNETVVILDHLEDPHNLGAIIRTAAASSFDGIIIPKDREVGVTSTVVKASVGTIFDMDVVQVTNIKNTIEELKKEGFWIVGTSMNGSDYRQIDYSGKIALVIGNEGKGMSKLVTDSCDFLASIPIASNVESLNASVAAGIMMYEVVRNRK